MDENQEECGRGMGSPDAETYIYAGKKMGSTVAAWKQGFRAELALVSGPSVNYSEALLDLAKAFDLVPHWVLIKEGLDIGYPLWLLRLSLAT